MAHGSRRFRSTSVGWLRAAAFALAALVAPGALGQVPTETCGAPPQAVVMALVLGAPGVLIAMALVLLGCWRPGPPRPQRPR